MVSVYRRLDSHSKANTAVCGRYSTHEKMLEAEQYPHSKPYGIIIVGDVTVLIAVVVIMLSLVIICIFAIVARYKWKLKVLRVSFFNNLF